MANVVQDLRHAFRMMRRTPGFIATAVIALAIGIGANTAIFSVVYTLLVQRLPYNDADRLAVVWEHNLPRDKQNNVVSPGNFLHWREMNRTFEDMAAVGLTFNLTLASGGEPEEVPMQYVTAALFPILGVQPQLGRPFTEEEDKPRARVVVISDRLWKRKLNADPAVLNRPIVLQGEPYTVLGVMPPGFSFLDQTVDVWVPPGFSAEARTPRGRWLAVVGRLKPGVTMQRAQQDMTRVAGELATMFPDFDSGWTAQVVPVREQLVGDVRPVLLVLLGAVGFVLLIACANVANLLLARASARERELAVRAALGAARGRLIRQLLSESMLLAFAGGAAGLALAWWSLRVLRTVAAGQLPVQRLDTVGLDPWVLSFTIGATLLTGVLFGIIPALSASGGSLTLSLKEGGRGASGARGGRTRGALVVAEIALALVLLVGAGLLIRSFASLIGTDPGFDPSRTVSMRVSLPASRYADTGKRVQFFTNVLSASSNLPGVESAGAVSYLPLAGLGSATGFQVVGKPVPPRGAEPVCDVRFVMGDYFAAMRVPLIAGRLFRADEADSRGKIVINAAMARKYFPGEDPVGKHVVVSWNDDLDDEIIGVVGDVRQAKLDTEARATIYWPYKREPAGAMALTIRTGGDPKSVVGGVVRLVHSQDPELAVASIRTMEEVVSNSVAQERLTTWLLGVFAAAALLLAAVGIYGVISYSVAQRQQEIGIRMALGAQRADVLGMVVRQALLLAVTGIALGGLAAFGLTRFMARLLFGVTPGDPLTFAVVSVVVLGVATLASYVPGRRATRVDPVVALRAE